MTEGFFIVLMLLAVLIYRYFSNTKKYETLLKIAELGETANEDLLKAIGKSKGTYKTDYKIGLIWLAIGIPTTLSFLVTEGSDSAILGSIFIFIGAAYLISGKYRWREDE